MIARFLLTVLIFLSLPSFGQTQDRYYPVAVWPFMYENFTEARIFVGENNKVVRAKSNINVENKMCKVVREDTVNGKIMRLYNCSYIDMDDFNKKYQMTHMGTVESSVLGAGFSDFTASVANNNALTREDMEPLQLKHTFYILKNGETFEARESEILSHLDGKEERKTYRGFTRSAEILYGSEKSMLNVYKTFFLKE